MHRSRERGFTLIELLIVVAIIGIIAAILIPNFLDSIQKARQKRVMSDMRNTGTAGMSYITDLWGAAAAGSSTQIDYSSDFFSIGFQEMTSLLIPRYIQKIPQIDSWKGEFLYYLDTDAGSTKSSFGIVGVLSGGADGGAPTGTYIRGPFEPTDYVQDLAWADGFFVRWPQRVTTN